MHRATRYATTGQRQQFLPGLDDGDTKVFSFVPEPRHWKQSGVQIGRWFIPLGRVHPVLRPLTPGIGSYVLSDHTEDPQPASE